MFLNLTKIFLQIDSDSGIALGLSIVVAIILGIGLFINWKATEASKLATEENSKVRYAQLLRDFDEDFKKILDKGSYIDTTEKAERYAVDYLNMLERIAYLNKKGKIPDDIAEYFSNYFYRRIFMLYVIIFK